MVLPTLCGLEEPLRSPEVFNNFTEGTGSPNTWKQVKMAETLFVPKEAIDYWRQIPSGPAAHLASGERTQKESINSRLEKVSESSNFQ